MTSRCKLTRVTDAAQELIGRFLGGAERLAGHVVANDTDAPRAA
jgi:hypothetical protein